MKIGVPRERKSLEKRVAITPDGVRSLTERGHTVAMEKGAGVGASFSDDEYLSAGGNIVDSLREIWHGSDLVVKVKEPHEEEYPYFRKGQLLFDYLHLASMPDVTEELLSAGVTGIAYELVQSDDGRLPLLEPMSEIAGKLSVLNGSYYLLSQNEGRGVLIGGAVGVPRGQVTVIGAGVSGRAATEIAFGMGAQVTVFDIDTRKLDDIRKEFGHQITTAYSTPAGVERALQTTDLLIGAVLVPGAAAPKIISRQMITSMPRGSVFIDISIDQGGCGETSRPTPLDQPTYLEEGVVHYGVCNMPAQTARTSTIALTNATLPYIIRLATLFDNAPGASSYEKGIHALKQAPILLEAVNTHAGKLTNAKVAEAVSMEYTPVKDALRA